MNKPLICITVALLIAAGSAQAERASHRSSFSVDKTRSTSQGTFTRHTEQTATGNGYTRASSATGPNGKTATRTASLAVDKDAGTATKTVETTKPNGESRTMVKQVAKAAQ